MTLDEARENVGADVVYTSAGQRAGVQPMRPKGGTIEWVNDTFVFVQYSFLGCAATRPEDLELLPEGTVIAQ